MTSERHENIGEAHGRRWYFDTFKGNGCLITSVTEWELDGDVETVAWDIYGAWAHYLACNPMARITEKAIKAQHEEWRAAAVRLVQERIAALGAEVKS